MNNAKKNTLKPINNNKNKLNNEIILFFILTQTRTEAFEDSNV